MNTLDARGLRKALEEEFEAGADQRRAEATKFALGYPATPNRAREVALRTFNGMERSFLANTKIHDQRDAETFQRHMREAHDVVSFYQDGGK